MITLTLSPEIKWQRTATNLEVCFICEEPIFSQVNSMNVEVKTNTKTEVIKVLNLCDSCKNLNEI